MVRSAIRIAAAAAIMMGALPLAAQAANTAVERGKYLVTIMGCTDCHTDGSLAGKPDMKRYLAGSSIGFFIPDLGYFYGPNLTPDKETGLGGWTAKQVATALTTGVRPDGRELAPIMPWRSYAHLTAKDALAMAAYLKSLPVVKNKVPGPFGPSEKPTSPYLNLVMPPSP